MPCIVVFTIKVQLKEKRLNLELSMKLSIKAIRAYSLKMNKFNKQLRKLFSTLVGGFVKYFTYENKSYECSNSVNDVIGNLLPTWQ